MKWLSGHSWRARLVTNSFYDASNEIRTSGGQTDKLSKGLVLN